MAIQVLAAGPQKKSFAQKLNAGVGRGLEQAQEMMREHEIKKFQEEEKQNITKFMNEKYGMNTQGLPADFQKEIMKHEAMNKGKQLIQSQKQEQLNELLKNLDLDQKENGQNQNLQMNEQKPRGILKPEFEDEQPSSSSKRSQGQKKLIPESVIAQAAAVNPAVADKLQKHNDNIMAQQRHDENLQIKKQKESPEHKRETALSSAQAKADVDYNQQLQESAKLNATKEKTLEDLDVLNEKGVTGKAYEKILEKFGLINLTSDGRREFSSGTKNLITDIRSILGSQFTGFEFQTILNAYPSADFSQGANRAIIRNLKEFQHIKSKEIQFAKEIKKENGGKIPEDFQSLVNDRLQEYAKTRLSDIKANTKIIMNEEYGIPEGFTLMFDPNGEPLSVPSEMINQYEEMGATIP